MNTPSKIPLWALCYLSDGNAMVTGLTEDACRLVTDTIHIPVLKGEYDGWTSIMGKAVVDGKL